MAELVDAPDLGSGVLVRESSSLSNPTIGLWCNDIWNISMVTRMCAYSKGSNPFRPTNL